VVTYGRFVNEIEKIVTAIVIFLVKLSPIGIFSLILPPLLATSVEQMVSFVGLYLIALFAAMIFQLIVVYPIIFFAFMRKNPFSYLNKFMTSGLTALGTASSAASIPVTMECAHKAGIRPDIYKLLVPLGVSLNMDGTAINLPMAIIFMAVGSSKALGMIDYIVLMFTYVLHLFIIYD
jgi:Na+/H+-dicarboxylate symporter